jgi:hypothetical protein
LQQTAIGRELQICCIALNVLLSSHAQAVSRWHCDPGDGDRRSEGDTKHPVRNPWGLTKPVSLVYSQLHPLSEPRIAQRLRSVEDLPFWDQRCEALESRTALNSEDAFHCGQRREFPSLKPI